MESSGRNGDDAKRSASDGGDAAHRPLERSPEGRFIVRSSSHPPGEQGEQTAGVDVSGVHDRPRGGAPSQPVARIEPERGRPGRSTPAERPRKRKELQQGGTYAAELRARCDTPRALPGTRISDRPGRAPWMAEPTAGVSGERSLPALAALTSAAVGAAEQAPAAVDEITRRVRRPSAPAPSEEAGPAARPPWRALVAAVAIGALFLLGVWLFG